jgi:hypothetical protein
MSIGWAWEADGAAVMVAGVRYARAAVTPAEIAEWAATLDRENEIVRILESAQLAYETGMANYRNATAQLGQLLDQERLARHRAQLRAADVAAFFEPSGLLAAFAGDAENLQTFALEAAAKLAQGK